MFSFRLIYIDSSFPFSRRNSCCRKLSSSDGCCKFRQNSYSCCYCCCCCKHTFSCRRQSSIFSRSSSNSHCRSGELAILDSFLLPCAAEGLEETLTFSTFSIAPFQVSITILFGSLSPADVSAITDAWFPISLLCTYFLMRSNINSFFYWPPQTLERNILALSLESILRWFHLAFLKTVQHDYTMSVFRSHLCFLFSASCLDLIVHSNLGQQVSVICMLEMYLSNNRRILCGNLQCLGEMVHCQLTIRNFYSFLLTYAWCHCRKIRNNFVLKVAVVCCLLSCFTSRRSIDGHFRLSLFCFV